jgi:DNA-binding transcriptional ArsR family regulator
MVMHGIPETEPLADMFRVLGDTTRLRILLACAEGEVPVGEIAKRLSLSQSLVSHHLRLLRAARLARGERRGRNVYYSLADAHVRRMIADMRAHAREPEISRARIRRIS